MMMKMKLPPNLIKIPNDLHMKSAVAGKRNKPNSAPDERRVDGRDQLADSPMRWSSSICIEASSSAAATGQRKPQPEDESENEVEAMTTRHASKPQKTPSTD